MTKTTMSKAEYSRHRGASKQTVGNWEKRGFLILDEGRIRVAETDRLLDARPPHYRGGRTRSRPGTPVPEPAPVEEPQDPSDPTAWTLQEACRRKEIALAQSREIALMRLKGELLLASDITPKWAQIILSIRSAMISIVGRATLEMGLSAVQSATLRKLIFDGLRHAAAGEDAPITNGHDPYAAP